MDAVLDREARFRVSRDHAWPVRSDLEKPRRFGVQTVLHEQEWGMRVEVRGRIQPETAFLTELRVLDALPIERRRPLDGGNPDALVEGVRSGPTQPSTEAHPRRLFEKMEGRVPEPARLARVCVREADELGACYPS